MFLNSDSKTFEEQGLYKYALRHKLVGCFNFFSETPTSTNLIAVPARYSSLCQPVNIIVKKIFPELLLLP